MGLGLSRPAGVTVGGVSRGWGDRGQALQPPLCCQVSVLSPEPRHRPGALLERAGPSRTAASSCGPILCSINTDKKEWAEMDKGGAHWAAEAHV